jgi:hypothetical protein
MKNKTKKKKKKKKKGGSKEGKKREEESKPMHVCFANLAVLTKHHKNKAHKN